jgi:hypothetical protein
MVRKAIQITWRLSMDFAKPYQIAVMLCVTLVLSGCLHSSPLTEVRLSDVTLCQGWDSKGVPVALPNVVPPTEERICICGHLETNTDVYLQVFWVGGGEVLLRDRRFFGSEPFLSCIEQTDGFEPGDDYGVEVVAGKIDLARIDFSVGP